VWRCIAGRFYFVCIRAWASFKVMIRASLFRGLSSASNVLIGAIPSSRRPPPPPPLPAAEWFSLRSGLRSALAGLGIVTPTSVQRAAVPTALRGGHVLISSATGEGKTLAFLLPIVHQLKEDEARGVSTRSARPRAIVISPTRELALQTTSVAKSLAHVEKFSVTSLVGGVDERRQRAALTDRAVDVVVATTGRLGKALQEGWISLSDVRYVALDEVDMLLDAKGDRAGDYGSFDQELSKVLRPIFATAARHARSARLMRNDGGDTDEVRVKIDDAGPFGSPTGGIPGASGAARGVDAQGERHVQFLLSGATLPPATLKIVRELLPGVTIAKTASSHRAPAKLKQTWVRIGSDPSAKHDALLNIAARLLGAPSHGGLAAKGDESSTAASRVLIFCNSIDSVRSTSHFLGEAGYAVATLHGGIPPNLRDAEFKLFTSGRARALVATDAASRGLDFSGGVKAVVLFDFPLAPTEFLHRAGRAARAGSQGEVVSIVAPGDVVLATALMRASSEQDLTLLTSEKTQYVPSSQQQAFRDARARRALARPVRESGKDRRYR
jgi:superfamily II DNA/RNA helicase